MVDTMRPTVVCHADWGTTSEKRWISRAVLEDGHYKTHAPTQVGDHRSLISRMRADCEKAGSILLGFDFPIGIPAAYAELVRVTDFKGFLLQLGEGEWSDFYSVCGKRSDISKYRPFYPYRPGGTKHKDLLDALGLEDINELRRRCELKTAERNAACPLFWTLGANQVGKGAIIGWHDVIVPALRDDPAVKLWPFDGALCELLRSGHVVVAEAYPAEYCRWLLGKPLRGKGRLEVRKNASGELLRWAELRGVLLDPDLETVIGQGFAEGDDSFDAVVGLFGMLEVVLGHRSPGCPSDTVAHAIEGWILGHVDSDNPNVDGCRVSQDP